MMSQQNINPVIITFGLLYVFELLLAEGLAISGIVVRAVVAALFVLIITIGLYLE